MKPLDGFLKTVEKDTITSLKSELIQAASAICAKHGLKCISVIYEPDKKSCNGDLDSFGIRVGISRVNVLGMDVLDNNFLRYASEKGMRPEWYGTTIVLENTEFVITGLDPVKNMVRVIRHDPEESQLISIDRVLDYMKIIKEQ